MPCVPSTESRDYVFELGGKGTDVILSLSILKEDWIRALAYIVPTPDPEEDEYIATESGAAIVTDEGDTITPN